MWGNNPSSTAVIINNLLQQGEPGFVFPTATFFCSLQEQIKASIKMITKLLFLQSKTSPEKQIHLVVSELLCPIARTFSLSHLYEHNTDNSFLSLMLRDMKLLETTELQRNQIAYGQRWVLLKQEIRGLLINCWKQFRKQRQLKEFILQAGKRKWKAVSRQDEHVDGSWPPSLSYAGEGGGRGRGEERKRK